MPLPIVIWLIALSFWSGTVYLQVTQNSRMIEQDRDTSTRLWDRLSDIDHRLSVIQGKLEERP
jgi:hypothetical protein